MDGRVNLTSRTRKKKVNLTELLLIVGTSRIIYNFLFIRYFALKAKSRIKLQKSKPCIISLIILMEAY